MVKLEEPVLVGVPLRTPVLPFNANHAGRLPALTRKAYVPEPPVAPSVVLHALFAVALASVPGLTVRLLALLLVVAVVALATAELMSAWMPAWLRATL